MFGRFFDQYKYLILLFFWIAVLALGYIGFSLLYPNETFSNLVYLTMHPLCTWTPVPIRDLLFLYLILQGH